MISRRRVSFHFTALALALVLTTLAFPSAPQKRIVKKLTRPNEPVQIVAVKMKAKPLEFGKPFAGRNDWPGGLSLVIKNASTKSVAWVKVALSFRREESLVRLSDYVTYGIGSSDIEKLRGGGPPLKPEKSAVISYSSEQYQSTRDILDDLGYPQRIAEIEVSVEQVSFEGEPDVLWIEGKMNGKDSHSPRGWSPLKP